MPLGTAVGAVVASVRVRLDQATNVIPLGIAMGVLVIAMNLIHNVWIAAPFLVMLGAIGGYMVVPMNALLQHRGHNLMGAGRSIAVQNFNEQACILGLGAFYTGMTKFGMSAFGADIRNPAVNEYRPDSFDADIGELRGLIAQMGGLAERAIAGAIEALLRDAGA